MKAHIIYRNFMNNEGTEMSVGGIQTYICNLVPILKKIGYDIHIYQISGRNFEVSFKDCVVHGYQYEKKEKGLPKFLYKCAREKLDKKRDLLIFGCETMVVKNDVSNTVAIQHGVFWDVPRFVGCNSFLYFAAFVKKSINAWNIVARIRNVKKLVCVDYNFVNWYRAQVAHSQIELCVIPNFSEIPCFKEEKQNEEMIKIIFARRFFEYRGTRIFVDAIKQLLENYHNIYVVIAGEGPDEKYLHNQLGNFQNVEFIRYESSESLRIHSDIQIAVVPTTGSEGTSLSLLEAMASQCAVICSNVGGMTNIVLDHYNGIIINPDVASLKNALREVVDDKELRQKLSINAYNTVQTAFSKEVWENRWMEVISEVTSQR